MAVSKMTKCTILVHSQTEMTLLAAIQELQTFEPITLRKETPIIEATLPHQNVSALSLENNDSSNDLTAVVSEQQHDVLEQLQHVQVQLQNVLHAQTVLQSVAVKKMQKKRLALTFEQLEQHAKRIQDEKVVDRILKLDEQYKQCEKQLQQLQIETESLEKWRYLNVLPTETSHIKVVVGTVEQHETDEIIKQLQRIDKLYVETVFQTKLEHGVVLLFNKAHENYINEQLKQLAVTPVTFESNDLPNHTLQHIQKQMQTLKQQRAHYHQAKKQLLPHYDELFVLEEMLVNKKMRLEAMQHIEQGRYVCALTGWIQNKHVERLKRLLDDTLLPTQYALLVDDTFETTDVPIALTNHPLVEPFEVLTEMYSLPKYDEVDPTAYMMPFYALFFGLMIADIGYGLLLLLGTFYLLKKGQLTHQLRKNVKMFHIVAYPALFWGVIFGSFFSFDTGFALLSPTANGMSLLLLSVIFGLCQLMFGLLINANEQLKKGDTHTAIADGFAWVVLLIGATVYAISAQLQQEQWQTIGYFMSIAGAFSIVLFTVTSAKNKLLGIGSGLYKLYGISSYIGDIASYTRLMALCVAGASIGSAFNQIIGMLPVYARFSIGIVLFLALHALNFGLAVLGAYVHGIRLMFVEFFGKFYEGGGRKHQPLKTYEKHVDLQQRYMEENK